ncbi:uncharacterized protein LAESUDRAFT_709850 [Laetiporus sulphureus 93-53]|uniref:Uncharacterized protein n=1 Tax=Laetiporus sulphureus 93-53 TaxID=1314785 RepID=A0A165I5R0_9APHY|nr:uncharacterized protein LAESUDRAFT_709850 [Laetiporus sulphureus 93-53]KZT12626.1 hypothetical protein LAESUDRAFT_709850 [Laetiporus sulphureus 93-53]
MAPIYPPRRLDTPITRSDIPAGVPSASWIIETYRCFVAPQAPLISSSLNDSLRDSVLLLGEITSLEMKTSIARFVHGRPASHSIERCRSGALRHCRRERKSRERGLCRDQNVMRNVDLPYLPLRNAYHRFKTSTNIRRRSEGKDTKQRYNQKTDAQDDIRTEGGTTGSGDVALDNGKWLITNDFASSF